MKASMIAVKKKVKYIVNMTALGIKLLKSTSVKYKNHIAVIIKNFDIKSN